ncbi:N-lysine methyltransferase SETD8 [Oryzias melastigma]|uniref:N-lysine methyltransferase SETD8 n=1 Tax=Oryzias melastigma TaxID=30732 RepID=A0A834CJ79_ORYME|nr:N-lysine methyltransferase SETD8 [Oryzias melastigma]
MQLKRKGFLLQNVPQGFEEADAEATLLQAESQKSQQIRRAAETEGNVRLTDEQKTGLAHHLGHTDKVAQVHYRMRDPPLPLPPTRLRTRQVLTERSSDDSEEDPASRKRPRPAEEFGRFAELFPVTLDGKPPNKVTRVEAGFSEDRTLYDRWRAEQFKLREAHLLAQWTRRPPTAKKIKREIEKEQWHSNCPSAESILERWEPPRKEDVESSSKLMKQVETQRWKYLAVVEPSPKAGEGKGVITTKTFPMNSILCDYHGEVISGAEGRRRMAERKNAMGYAFFFKCGKEDLCIDATNTPCPCHPDQETFGGLINHSKKRPNVRPAATLMNFPGGQRYVLFFRAMRDLAVNEELLFDYGVCRDSFGGEGADLTWLDE